MQCSNTKINWERTHQIQATFHISRGMHEVGLIFITPIFWNLDNCRANIWPLFTDRHCAPRHYPKATRNLQISTHSRRPHLHWGSILSTIYIEWVLTIDIFELFCKNFSFPGSGSPPSPICRIVLLRVATRLKRSNLRPRKSGFPIWISSDIRYLAAFLLLRQHPLQTGFTYFPQDEFLELSRLASGTFGSVVKVWIYLIKFCCESLVKKWG